MQYRFNQIHRDLSIELEKNSQINRGTYASGWLPPHIDYNGYHVGEVTSSTADLLTSTADRIDVETPLVTIDHDSITSNASNRIYMTGLPHKIMMYGYTIVLDSRPSMYANTVIELPTSPTSGTRQDYVFIEVWKEKVERENSCLFPYGNVGFDPYDDETTFDGCTLYSDSKIVDNYPNYLAGTYGNPTIDSSYHGKYIEMHDNNLDTFLANPLNNVFISEDGNFYQIRYRICSLIGFKNNPESSLFLYDNEDTTSYYRPQGQLASRPTKGTSNTDSNGIIVRQYDSSLYSSTIKDAGLWLGGLYTNNDTSISTISTLSYDGYTFNSPLFICQRRNSTSWDFDNPNGGGSIASSTSGRFDDKYYDEIHIDDVLDLRHTVGVKNIEEMKDKSFQLLLQNDLTTFWEDTKVQPGGPYSPQTFENSGICSTKPLRYEGISGTSIELYESIFGSTGSNFITNGTFNSDLGSWNLYNPEFSSSYPIGHYLDSPSQAYGIWSDGTFVYCANNTTLRSYEFDFNDGDGEWSLKDSYTTGGICQSVWGDGTYVYAACGSAGVQAFSVNSIGDFSHEATLSLTDANRVWGDGTHIYISEGTEGDLSIYTFNGSWSAEINAHNTGAQSYSGFADENYLYHTNNTGVYGMTWDHSSSLGTPVLQTLTGTTKGITGDGTYIYVNTSTYLYVLTFNGSWTIVDSISTPSDGRESIVVIDHIIYTADGSGGYKCFTFNGSELSYIDGINTSWTTHDVWTDGVYLYIADREYYKIVDLLHPSLKSLEVDIKTTVLDTIGSGDGNKVWSDGSHYFITAGGNTHKYSLDGSGNFTLVDFDGTYNYHTEVWGDGNNIYIGQSSTYGILVYDSSFTYQSYENSISNQVYDIWGDGSRLFAAFYNAGIASYTVSGTNLTFVSSDDTDAIYSRAITGDSINQIVFVADSSRGLKAFSYTAGGALSFEGEFYTAEGWSGWAYDIEFDGTYLYVANSIRGVLVFSYAGGTFTLEDENSDFFDCKSLYVYSDYVFVTHSNGIGIYTKSGSKLILTTSYEYNINDCNAVYADANFMVAAFDNIGGRSFTYGSNCMEISGGGVGDGFAYQQITGLTVGSLYVFKANVKAMNSTVQNINISDTLQTGTEYSYSNSAITGDWKSYTGVFKATATSLYIQIGFTSESVDETLRFDDVEVYQIDVGDDTIINQVNYCPNSIPTTLDGYRNYFSDEGGEQAIHSLLTLGDSNGIFESSSGTSGLDMLDEYSAGERVFAVTRDSDGYYHAAAYYTTKIITFTIDDDGKINFIRYKKPSYQEYMKDIFWDSDNEFLYTFSNYGYLRSYVINDGVITEIGSHTDTSLWYGQCIYSDGTYVYVGGAYYGRLQRYEINTSTGELTSSGLKDLGSGDVKSIWGDDNYIYVANNNQTTEGIVVYDTSFNFVKRNQIPSGNVRGVWTDNNNYVYVADSILGLLVFNKDGAGVLSQVASDPSIAPYKIKGHGGSIYVTHNTGVSVYDAYDGVNEFISISNYTTNQLDYALFVDDDWVVTGGTTTATASKIRTFDTVSSATVTVDLTKLEANNGSDDLRPSISPRTIETNWNGDPNPGQDDSHKGLGSKVDISWVSYNNDRSRGIISPVTYVALNSSSSTIYSGDVYRNAADTVRITITGKKYGVTTWHSGSYTGTTIPTNGTYTFVSGNSNSDTTVYFVAYNGMKFDQWDSYNDARWVGEGINLHAEEDILITAFAHYKEGSGFLSRVPCKRRETEYIDGVESIIATQFYVDGIQQLPNDGIGFHPFGVSVEPEISDDGTPNTHAKSTGLVGFVNKGAVITQDTIGTVDDRGCETPHIMWDDDDQIFKLWYGLIDTDRIFTVGYATSSDGITWANHQQVLSTTEAARFTGGIKHPYVIKDGSTYKMWYTGILSDGTKEIGYATSSNGTTWTDYGSSVVVPLTIDSSIRRVRQPCVIKDESDGSFPYKMYIGVNHTSYGNGIALLQSSNGTSWTYVDMILTSDFLGIYDDNIHSICVIKEDDIYRMWYSSSALDDEDATDNTFRALYTFSGDGQNWHTPVLFMNVATEGIHDTTDVGSMSMTKKDKTYHGLYFGKGIAEAGRKALIYMMLSTSDENGENSSGVGVYETKGPMNLAPQPNSSILVIYEHRALQQTTSRFELNGDTYDLTYNLYQKPITGIATTLGTGGRPNNTNYPLYYRDCISNIQISGTYELKGDGAFPMVGHNSRSASNQDDTFIDGIQVISDNAGVVTTNNNIKSGDFISISGLSSRETNGLIEAFTSSSYNIFGDGTIYSQSLIYSGYSKLAGIIPGIGEKNKLLFMPVAYSYNSDENSIITFDSYATFNLLGRPIIK